jgi:uncharacterized LabA/DUF88 family protein
VKTIVYIDGFNLYYGCLKDTPYKWLNIHRMSELLLPNETIVSIKYFTAKVFSRSSDPQKHIRQQVYWRALRTLPNLEIIEGHYSEHNKWMRVAHPKPGKSKYAEVIKTEEKGSDVNLAVHLLHDGYRGMYELAVVVSNDSDLLSAIEIVQKDLGLVAGILNPQEHPSKELKDEALFIKQIRTGVIRASQFPDIMTDAKGSFHKPIDWQEN